MQQVGNNYIAANATVCGDVRLGGGVNIWFGTIVRADVAPITLGSRVNLQDGCVVHTDTDAPQEIEEGVVVGHRAILHGTRIGRDSLIGMGAILLSGSVIGAECLIAAGTLVPEGRVIPPRSVVMGSPGKLVRPITEQELERTRRIGRDYLDRARRHVDGEYPLVVGTLRAPSA